MQKIQFIVLAKMDNLIWNDSHIIILAKMDTFTLNDFSLISFFFEFTFIFVWHWLGSQKYLLVFYGSTFLLRFTTFVHRWQHDPLICRYQMYLTCEFVPTKIEVLSGRKEVEVEEEWKFPNIMILARSKTAH